MKLIPLTLGLFAKISDRWARRYTWQAAKCKGKFYARRGRVTMMHGEILGVKGADHRNGDTLDNRRCNLRRATSTQNNQNRVKRTESTTSRFKGVSWSKLHNRWRADITYLKRHIFLGCFDSEPEAARRYDRAAKRFFGPFARPNFS